MLDRTRLALRADGFRPLEGPLPLIAIGVGLVGLDLVARFMPHGAIGMPMAASALIAGFLMRSRPVAFLVPIAALAISDTYLGGYDWRIMASVYLTLGLPALLGGLARTRYAALVLAGLSLASSLLFFVVVNFAVWRFGHLYPVTPSGLFESYVAGLPFLRAATESNLGWTLALFAIVAGARSFQEHPVSPALARTA